MTDTTEMNYAEVRCPEAPDRPPPARPPRGEGTAAPFGGRGARGDSRLGCRDPWHLHTIFFRLRASYRLLPL